MASRPDVFRPHESALGYYRNRSGFNDREVEDELRPGAFRIVALGDSFTFGFAPYPRAYLTVAEAVATLHTRGSPPVSVHNLGLAAMGIADYRLVYRFFGRPLAADLVVVTIYLGNDLLDFAGHGVAQDCAPAGPQSWLVTFLRRVTRIAREGAVAEPAEARSSPSEARGGTRVPGAREPDLSRPRFSDDAWLEVKAKELVSFRNGAALDCRLEAFFEELERLRTDLAADGVAMALVLAPTRLQTEPPELRAALAQAELLESEIDLHRPGREISGWARTRGVPLLDLTPSFQDRATSGLYVPNDTHWNIEGNELAGLLVGAWIAAELVERGQLSESPDRPAPATAAAARGASASEAGASTGASTGSSTDAASGNVSP